MRPTKASSVKIPVLDTRVSKPARGTVAWYAGLGVMTALEVIEWPVALVIAAGHAIATHTNKPDVEGAAQGAQAGT